MSSHSARTAAALFRARVTGPCASGTPWPTILCSLWETMTKRLRRWPSAPMAPGSTRLRPTEPYAFGTHEQTQRLDEAGYDAQTDWHFFAAFAKLRRTWRRG